MAVVRPPVVGPKVGRAVVVVVVAAAGTAAAAAVLRVVLHVVRPEVAAGGSAEDPAAIQAAWVGQPGAGTPSAS